MPSGPVASSRPAPMTWRWSGFQRTGGAGGYGVGPLRWLTRCEPRSPNTAGPMSFVSSPVDAARLLGLLRVELGRTPVGVYQHESQLLYPNSRGGDANDANALYDWFSWLAADVVFSNSDWHRRQVVEALPSFVERFPDADHSPLRGRLPERFETLPLGLDLSWASPSPDRFDGGGPVIVWPHRWESDKDPAAFVRAIDRLDEIGLDFRLVLAGEAGPFGGEDRNRLAARHHRRVLAVGPFSVEEYRHWLRRSDIVVSCARHDFFGVGIAEAVAAGCVPVVPDALHYPDLLGATADEFTYRPGTFGTRLAEVVSEIEPWRAPLEPVRAAVRRFQWEAMASVYDEHLERLASRSIGDR